jgi:hypothetical protein
MKTMNAIFGATTAALLLVGTGARASITIPDGNPTGVADTLTESGLNFSISSVTLTLNVSGGNNGDLYAYLSYDGHIVTLLNQPGVTGINPLGYTDSGFNVTLSDGSYGNINNYGSGSYSVNGSGQVTGTYNATGGSTSFGTAFNNLNPNGTWTLFIADLSGGGGTSTLNTWSLDITAVPEPVTWALIIFGAGGLLIGLGRWCRVHFQRTAQ